jgi:hypothetical protein
MVKFLLMPNHLFQALRALRLKYPNDRDIIKSLTWTDGNVSSVAFRPSFAGIGSDHKEILKVKGLPTAYSVNNLVEDYMKYSRKKFGRETKIHS